MTLPLRFSKEAAPGRAQNAPIVALESTIITHGMPYPDNIKMVQAVEADIRAEGAIPATIALMDGEILIGLDPEQLQNLATQEHVRKVSRADFAACLAMRATGATTVAATMIAAHLAKIAVFATGGIGGVHRGAAHSFDISADLPELAQTPVNVVCAGAKAILDLPKTFEYLETQGVPVIAYGQDQLPAFWSRDSEITAPLRMDSPEEIAAFYALRHKLGLAGGQLITNPIPREAEIPHERIAPWISDALAQAEEAGISGKAVTPFLLERIVALSAGQSLVSNIALVRHNARLAARIACALKKYEK